MGVGGEGVVLLRDHMTPLFVLLNIYPVGSVLLHHHLCRARLNDISPVRVYISSLHQFIDPFAIVYFRWN